MHRVVYQLQREILDVKVEWFLRMTASGHVLFTANAHRENGKKFIVGPDKRLATFLGT